MQSILSIPTSDAPTSKEVEVAADTFYQAVAKAGKPLPVIIVRAGEMGAYTIASGWTGWIPAYRGANAQERVVDVTGGGNAYLGGLCAGLLLSGGDYRLGEQGIYVLNTRVSLI